MNSIQRIRWQTIVLAALTGGCASSSTTVSHTGVVTSERIYDVVTAQQQTIATMEGTGRFSIQTPELAYSGSFELMLKKPDSLLLRIEGPFGIDYGAALLSRREFQFYDVFQNRLIIGETTPANLERVFRMAVTFDDLLALVAGGAFLATDEPAHGRLERGNSSYVLTFAGDYLSRQYLIDAASLMITRVLFVRPGGTVIAEQHFGDFRPVDGLLVPFELKVIQQPGQRMVALRYSEVSFNQPSTELRFTVPLSARRIYLQ